MLEKIEGYVVEIDFSQTDKTYVFVKGAKTREEAAEAVKKTTNCPRVYGWYAINSVLEV